MYNRTATNKRLTNSFIDGEDSVFKEERTKPKAVVKVKKEKLPKPTFTKRRNRGMTEVVFYGVMFLTSLVSLGMTFYLAHFGGAIASLLAVIFSLYGFLFTNPDRWSEENKELSFWNVSVTMSVLLKSLHINLYKWRNVLMWIFASGLTLSYFVSDSMVGVFGGLYLLTGILFLAERNFETYSKVALGLAWISVPALILALILSKSISLGIVTVALLLYQVYERVRNLEIEEPRFENEVV